MRMFGYSRYGGPEVLKFFDVPRPRPGAHDLLIELRAASINPADIKVRNGVRQKSFPVQFPMAVGREAAGIVREAPRNSPFHSGQLVFGGTSAGTGALQQFVLLDITQTALIPRGLSAGEAACIPVAWATAWDALEELSLEKGSVVLVLGGGGGVGTAAIQLAHVLGLHPVGVGSSAKRDYIRQQGADFIGYDEPDWVQQLTSLLSTRAGLSRGTTTLPAEKLAGGIVDAAGGTTLRRTAGLVSSGKIRSAADPALATQLGGSGIVRRRTGEVYEELARLMAAGKINARLTHTYGFNDAAEAVAVVESGHSTGKTVVTHAAQPM